MAASITQPITGARLGDLAMPLGKWVRPWRLLYGAGPTNGTLLFGRNIWQRPLTDALAIGRQLTELLLKFGR